MNDPRHRDEMTDWITETVTRHGDLMRHYAARVLGFERDQASDVVQEAFLKLCRRAREDGLKKAPDHLLEWLFTVVRNQAIDLKRKEKKKMPLTQERTETLAMPMADPSQRAEQNEQEGILMLFLDQLPASQQEVIRLKFQNGFKYEEISRITGHSSGQVGWLIHHGVKSLRAAMTAESQAQKSISSTTPLG